MVGWEIVDRPGYFGASREELHKKFDDQYGVNQWCLGWQWGDRIIFKPEALQIYEDAYYEHLKKEREVLNWLTRVASDVYDTAPSNVNAGFDYNLQETSSNHIQDVAVRRAVLRLGEMFQGKRLLHIRPEQEGERLSPHLVPFHLPYMIYHGKIKYKGRERDFEKNPPWWTKMGIPNSVEQFYQQNKLLLKAA